MVSSPNKEELYKLGVQAAKNGQKQPARMMFQQVLQQDSRDTRAMMWMAKLAPTPKERATWLGRVLRIDPRNETARQALNKLETRDVAARNRILLRVGVLVYVVVILIISILIIVTA